MEQAVFIREETAKLFGSRYETHDKSVVPVFKRGAIQGYALIVEGKAITEKELEYA